MFHKLTAYHSSTPFTNKHPRFQCRIGVVIFPALRIVKTTVMRFLLPTLILSLALPTFGGPIVRETGALYLSDFDVPPVKLALKEAAPCYFDITGNRYAGTLRFPQVVRLDAVSPGGRLRVRGNARQGGVAAWVDPAFLDPLPPDFIPSLQRAEERRKQVEELIANNEVAIGMTPDEVTRSLGKPQKRSSRTERDGSAQVFEYIKYKLVPQTVFTPSYAQTITGYVPRPGERLQTVVMSGQAGYSPGTIFVKVPVGTVKVSFKNGVVESLEQSEGTLVGGNASIVVPPINVTW